MINYLGGLVIVFMPLTLKNWGILLLGKPSVHPLKNKEGF